MPFFYYGIFERIGERNFVPTLGSAVDRYLEAHPVQWRDWEDDQCVRRRFS
jgi:hypothetical protein